jgi:sec-independent protein translocase protein TatC
MSSDAAADPEPKDEGMTFWEHLEELRSRLFRMSLAAAAGGTAAWFVRTEVLTWLLKPFKEGWEAHFKDPPTIHFPDPAGLFIAYVKVSVIVGVVFALPIIFYQLWAFVAPGLYAKEKRFALPFVTASTLLFCTGVYLGMTYAFPAAFSFLLGISVDMPEGVLIKPTIMVEDYISFISRMLIAFGAVFELPVVVFFLSVAGIVNHRHLLKFFRYFIVIAFVAAAILTPPDLLSQIIMAGALIFLYCISIGIAWIFAKNRPT